MKYFTLHAHNDSGTVTKGKKLLDLKNVEPKAFSLIFGSMFHHFMDGVLIGAAFKGNSILFVTKISK